jgi:hypothetical protein
MGLEHNVRLTDIYNFSSNRTGNRTRLRDNHHPVSDGWGIIRVVFLVRCEIRVGDRPAKLSMNLMTETDPVSETSFRILDNGRSPRTRYF